MEISIYVFCCFWRKNTIYECFYSQYLKVKPKTVLLNLFICYSSNTLLETTNTTIGYAPIEAICSTSYSGAAISVLLDHDEFSVAVNMAHELGHNLGMYHDTEYPGCEYENYIMHSDQE